MTNNINTTGEQKVGAAGRPDFGKLAMAGVQVTLGADGAPVGNAKTPVTGKRTVKKSEEGVKVMRDMPIQSGHAMSPEFPEWRVGLTPEKYHAKVLQEAELKAKGQKKQKIAPELTLSESQAYLNWLTEQGMEVSTESAVKSFEDAKNETMGQVVAEAEKKVGKKPGRKPGRPAKEVLAADAA